MPAVNQDVEHWLGDTKHITIPVRDNTGSPVDLSGASARWWMGRSPSSKGTGVLLKKESGSGLTLSLVNGLWSINLNLDPADTQNLKPGTYYHEAEVIDAAGEVTTVTTGSYTLIQTMIPPEV